MLRMLEAQAPAKQTATDTINTLSGRLANATLLEDRRAAILGLRSFAKEYPASVASGSLRDLIGCLVKDAEDVDTLKVVLETLLMLFNPDERSPEASEDIALWLADEFTQRQDNITLLLDLLESSEFYSRLYSLQLLQAISSLRAERTQECILTAPLGTTRLVAILDDSRDAIRNAGLLLLTDLTQASTELQKLVAFESAFDRVFNLIQAEGSIEQGGIVVQDCLSLVANLIQFNAANQSLFRETGGVAKLASLLPGDSLQKGGTDGGEEDWTSPQRDKNLWGLLAILRMFLTRGSISTQPNQNAFIKHGLLQKVLNLAFKATTTIPIRAEALNTCADMVRGNPRIQETFAQLQVNQPNNEGQKPNGGRAPNGVPKMFIIDALLDLILSVSSSQMFEARFAACECIKAYFYNHVQIRLHFLHRAIDGHLSGEDETPNVLSTLIRPTFDTNTNDPYRNWFASVLVFHLIFEDAEAKSILMKVTEGDAESGEEVVTCIQAITSNLISGLQTAQNERIIIGYLMLLCGWLFEHGASVNDFLGEGSSLQSIIQSAIRVMNGQVMVRGLCAVLLGIIYEFATKDSPVPRRELQPMLLSGLGRERYLDAITQLRQHHIVREFEVLPHGASPDSPSGLPGVYFDATFVEFLKDNFSRLSRAIDRDPGLEIVQTPQGIDRDLVDSLRGQLEEKIQALQKVEGDMLSMERRQNQEQAEHRRALESSMSELNRIKHINEALQANHESDNRKAEASRRKELQDLEEQYRRQMHNLNLQNQQAQREAMEKAVKTQQTHSGEIHRLKGEYGELELRFKKVNEERITAQNGIKELQQMAQKTKEELVSVKNTISTVDGALTQSKTQIDELTKTKVQLQELIDKSKLENEQLRTKLQDQTWAVKGLEEKLKKAEQSVKEKDEARASVQADLDNLLIMLGDLEEKRSKDKKRLKALGEEVSDGEDDDDDEEDDEEEEEESDVD